MGDRICVMKDGRIMQVAAPLEIYNHPANLFVAGFIGSPSMNFFRGAIHPKDGGVAFVETNPKAPPLTVPLAGTLGAKAAALPGRDVVLGLRPEHIQEVAGAGEGYDVKVEIAEPMGAETYLHLDSGATAFVARVAPTHAHRAGEMVRVRFDLAHARLFDAASELAL